MKILLCLAALGLLGCVDDEIERSSGSGTVHLKLDYDGPVPEGAVITAAVMICPFTMPPLMLEPPQFSVSSFPVEGDLEGLPAGEICLYVYMDVDDSDGFQPKPGLDPVNRLPEGALSLPITLPEGGRVDLEVELHLEGAGVDEGVQDGGVEEDIGSTEDGGADVEEESISISLKISCDHCGSEPALFYGTRGSSIGMPSYYHLFEQPQFPLEVELSSSSTVTGQEIPWEAGEVTFQSYQNSIPGGMLPQEGEPVAPAQTHRLHPGSNTLEFVLE